MGLTWIKNNGNIIDIVKDNNIKNEYEVIKYNINKKLYSLYDKNTIDVKIKIWVIIINCIKENVYNSKVIVINNILGLIVNDKEIKDGVYRERLDNI